MATKDDKDPKSPATTSKAYDAMLPRWQLMATLLGGTEAMRAAGETYLPKHEEETDLGYQERLQQAVLLNMTEQTLDNLSGKPFSEEMKLGEDIPEAMGPILEDIDLQGNNTHVFSRGWFAESLAKAFCHVLVDMPKPVVREDGQPRTLEDDRKDGTRPYWVLIRPETVIFARASVIGGKEVLQEVRIMETYTEQNGFAEISKVRIRRLLPGMVELYIPKKVKNKEVWEKYDWWASALPYIPLVTYYTNREGLCLGKSPLLDLAYLNTAHWQSTADQRHILKVARFPILACSGASKDDSDPVVVGPNKVLYNEDAQGKFYYVEHQGNAIEAGRKDLEDLERQMAGYGAEFLKDEPGDATATAKALDSSEANSNLASMVSEFEDAIAQALQMTADWMKIKLDGGDVELLKEYSEAPADVAGLDHLQKARASKEISRKAYLEGLRSRGVLPEDFDPEEDLDELQGEPLTGMDAMLDLDPSGKPIVPVPGPAPAPAKKPAPAAKKPLKKGPAK